MKEILGFREKGTLGNTLVDNLVDTLVNTGAKTLVSTLVKALVNTQVNTSGHLLVTWVFSNFRFSDVRFSIFSSGTYFRKICW